MIHACVASGIGDGQAPVAHTPPGVPSDIPPLPPDREPPDIILPPQSPPLQPPEEFPPRVPPPPRPESPPVPPRISA